VHKIVTTEEMRSIEKDVDQSGLSYDQMMQNAGKTIADSIIEFLTEIKGKRVVILVGTGNNGGDGLVIGYHLHESGAQVAVYLASERASGDPNLERLKQKEILIANSKEDQRSRVLKNLLASTEIVIDAVLGTGFQLPLKGNAKELLSNTKTALEKRECKPIVVAVDCPSGLDCDSGEIAKEALEADLTVTLAAAKHGLLRFPGASYVGKLVVGDIGIPSNHKKLSKIQIEISEEKELSTWLPKRPRDAHKGTFGRVLVVAGSINFPGSAALSARAAYRVGAGLVTMAVPSPVQPLIASLLPEATWILLPHELGVISENALNVVTTELEHTEALVFGPGFGMESTTKAFISKFFGIELHHQQKQIGFIHPEQLPSKARSIPPCIIDADGLKLLSQLDQWYTYLPEGSILTPHPGEMAMMTGVAKEEIQEDRITAAQKWAKTWGHIIVLKGAFTVVASPNGDAVVIPIASPALARAGTGDVLAGTIAGFRAQGVEAFQSAILGSYVHGKAGEFAAEYLGTSASVLAGDVADAIPSVLYDLECC